MCKVHVRGGWEGCVNETHTISHRTPLFISLVKQIKTTKGPLTLKEYPKAQSFPETNQIMLWQKFSKVLLLFLYS